LIDAIGHSLGWGWVALFAAWAAGSLLILTGVQRWFLERYATRIPTIVLFIAWTLAVVGVGGRLFGYGAPAG
jgi:hypothetical protein